MEVECQETFNADMWDKKVVLYGIGRIFERYQTYLNWNNIVAIVDMDADKQGSCINQKKIEPPEKITSLEYDYIVIFTNLYFENAKINLVGNYFVEEQKIVSWRIFFKVDTINDSSIYNVIPERVQLYKDYIKSGTGRAIIDIGKQQLEKVLLTNESFLFDIDNLGHLRFVLHRSFYRNCYEKCSKIERVYDVVLLWGDFEEDIQWSDLVKFSQNVIIWTVSYSYSTHENYTDNVNKFEKWGKKKTFLFSDAIVLVFTKESAKEKPDCKIFVVTHKKYNVLADSIYKPICVGDQYENRNFYTEHAGENIAYLNDRLNECTALYWIWKNTDSEYVGLNHYRRYFYNSEVKNYANYLTEDKIIEIFEDGYDIILPRITRLGMSVLNNIRKEIGQELADRALEIVRRLIEERIPMYASAFEYAMSKRIFYKCQLFVTKRVLLDDYCEWLFSFIIDAAKMFDVSSCDTHHKRAIGYFAETMLTVWLLEQNVRVKELPIIDI
ncbi:MAG: DUF4422 domain-containing protein [Blautia sp.]|nr:DUF4422 domain-containing protein [Blautia sp.]MCM1200766.1 DUF4422 domain-containing protein [Bacteroides fragilis]